MSSRLDRLVSLLESGSSSSIRQTAAKQLAQLATKNVASDISFVEDSKHHAADYSSLMAVVSRILPCLRSKNFETRTSASSALSQICNAVPVWTPPVLHSPKDERGEDSTDDAAPYPPLDLMALMYQTSPLVASTGREFSRPAATYSNPAELRKAKKEAMKRLGIDFLEGVDEDAMDWEAELGNGNLTPESEAAVKIEEDVKKETPPAQREEIISPTAAKEQEPPPTPNSSLSARELNRLKRKRKGGAAAVAAVAPPKAPSDSKYATAMARESSPKVRLLTSQTGETTSGLTQPSPLGQQDEKAIVDPSKGGQVEAAQSNMLSLAKMIEVSEGHWPWEGVIRVLEIDLFDPSWATRHGAACAIRDILKPQGASSGMSAKFSPRENRRAHERWCNDLAAKILCVLVLDRFCDFSSDQSVSPVRESAAQTLASLFMHMPKRSLCETHEILLQMARQDFTAEDSGKPYIWQVRHGGMLGLKYEVAVRRDIFILEIKAEDEGAMDVVEADATPPATRTDFLKSVVSTAILGLGDSDDDVRSVAASTLVPVASDIVKLLPDELPLVLAVLWDGLANMKDDLSSSVGAVMELLGKLVAFPEVISVLGNPEASKPLSSLAPTLFSFFRHTIANVRVQVVTTLHSFLLVDELPKDWLSSAFLCLLFQNLLVEERAHIREATLSIWKTSIRLLSGMENVLPAVVSSPLISDWYALMLQPWGQPLDFSLFFQLPPHGAQTSVNNDKLQERHNVDKAMLAQDVVLVTAEVIWESRIACAQAMGYLIATWPSASEADTIFRSIILHYLSSSSALQRVIVSVVTEECARERMTFNSSVEEGTSSRSLDSQFVAAIAEALFAVVGQNAPKCYLETMPNLRRLSSDCASLLNKFGSSGSVSAEEIPSVPLEIDCTGQRTDVFNVDVAKRVAGPIFDGLKPRLSRMKKKELATYEALRASLFSHIESWNTSKDRYDVRVLAAAAATLVAFESVPAKVGSVIKNLMNGIKFEETLIFQTRFSSSLAGMVDLGLAKLNAVVPLTKVVKNLCAFLCSDPSQTPSFDPSPNRSKGILSFRLASSANDKTENHETLEQMTARISRRGAELALGQLSRRFGIQLFERVPMIWQATTDGLISACQGGELDDVNARLEKHSGQDVIDSLITIQTVVPALHCELYHRVVQLLPFVLLTLRSRFAVVRQTAARCLATICDVITSEGMHFTVKHVIPLLGNAKSVTDRQGAIEAVFNIVARLDAKALPYVIFLVVPVLGRMSDSDDDIRSTATNTFASLVKMVPLEVGLPDPEGFPPELLERRDKERGFLAQLLDGSKVEHYDLPVPINAELRKYQVDGVNWLAFLAKYQLHGILCDDMGLGKTLQSICILASKHFERKERHRNSPGPDTTLVPSLIVCPPTLTGHWYYEIKKYAESLRPIMYTGAARERSRMAPKLNQYDVVITSYEVVRNDVQCLGALEWLYCILDEGHVIKNPKTKLAKAVKSIRAQHRVILSGTPIQNNVLELWSLFDFLMPGFLGTERSFNERYGKPILANRDSKSPAKTSEAAALALEALHKQVLPFLLRRLKEDVLDDLPPKIIQDYYCELSDLQKQLYDDFSQSEAYTQAQTAVKNNGGGQQHVFQSLQYLKKLCNHPALVLKEGDEATKRILQKFRKINDNASPLRDLTHAPKLQALRQLLNDCGIGLSSSGTGDDTRKGSPSDNGLETSTFSQHRVLIFCQMKQMIDIIEKDLFKPLMPSVTYMRLDGGTETHKRHAIVQTFNADPSIDCLLLTTHVGGLGLTLTGADTVIFVEHDWNPMKDLQAMDRAHRIGQKKVVNVYRLITKDTLEEKIMGLQRFKLNIANSIITQQNSGLSSMSTDLVLDLFKRTPEDESSKKKKVQEGPVSQKNILTGLEELSAEGEYDSLDLSSFLSS